MFYVLTSAKFLFPVRNQLTIILIHSALLNLTLETVIGKEHAIFLTFLENGKFKMMALAGLSCCVPHMTEREKVDECCVPHREEREPTPAGLFCNNINPFIRVDASYPNLGTSQKASPPNTNALGIKFPTHEF